MEIINIETLLALCSILDDYPKLKKDLDNLQRSRISGNWLYNLYALSKGKFTLCSKAERKFYKENKDIFDKIYANSPILEFIIDASSRDYFYHYIVAHQEDIESIQAVLKTLKHLGFRRINFDASKNFSDQTYTVNRTFMDNFKVNYLDNIEIIPNYNSSVIKYTSKGSPYLIEGNVFLGKRINYGTITLNTLVFDEESLPKAISKEELFDHIEYLYNQNETKHNIVYNALNLFNDVEVLEKNCNAALASVSNLPEDYRPQVDNSLIAIKDQLKLVSDKLVEYHEYITTTNPLITKEQFSDEKKVASRVRRSN